MNGKDRNGMGKIGWELDWLNIKSRLKLSADKSRNAAGRIAIFKFHLDIVDEVSHIERLKQIFVRKTRCGRCVAIESSLSFSDR